MRSFFKARLKTFTINGFIKYALGEIVLIVVGILVAFQLSNWAEKEKARSIEIETLIDLREALLLDKNDLEFNIYLYKKVVTSCDTILALLDNRLAYEPSMNKYFSGPSLVAVFFSNVGPYETLRSRGLEIVTNDSIRNQIVRVYEFNYTGLRKFESQLTDYVQSMEKMFNPKHFDQSYPFDVTNMNLYGDMTPHDFASLKNNKEYIHLIKTVKNKTNFFLHGTVIGTSERTQRLIENLALEIHRLD